MPDHALFQKHPVIRYSMTSGFLTKIDANYLGDMEISKNQWTDWQLLLHFMANDERLLDCKYQTSLVFYDRKKKIAKPHCDHTSLTSVSLKGNFAAHNKMVFRKTDFQENDEG